ncbi:polysaccharide lyase family 9 protein [Didymella exigua CBS 183.55]|uniref:Polysaccharide lyase family 9 protein n=1 Tax=Didymella exigua CBS 183.55 TaxID=1150837 RepID=A0A6A5R9G2_9PLEO|nr:polysaccharide lyase family 9 protein [Didymella exigua CBS 183.55]KAF1923969.1 polysaccharide lyase family 9 protein [Didymella exigua CBS 183.55]
MPFPPSFRVVETGFQLKGTFSNSTVFHFEAYRTRDLCKDGESANDFIYKSGEGEGNVLRYARLWGNVDDSLDCARPDPEKSPAKHIVRNSMASSNVKKGSIYHDSLGELTVERTTA